MLNLSELHKKATAANIAANDGETTSIFKYPEVVDFIKAASPLVVMKLIDMVTKSQFRHGDQEWNAMPQSDGSVRVVGRIVVNGHPIYSINTFERPPTRSEHVNEWVEMMQDTLYQKVGRYLMTGEDE